MKTLVVECPDQLHERVNALVRDGWAKDVGQAVTEALRRFLESHRPELVESQIRADMEWGLRGDD